MGIINRGETFSDEGLKNSWRWEWTSEICKVSDERKEKVGDYIRKVDQVGTARCQLCKTGINYTNRGLTALTDHLKTKKHQDNVTALKNNTSLPGKIFILLLKKKKSTSD